MKLNQPQINAILAGLRMLELAVLNDEVPPDIAAILDDGVDAEDGLTDLDIDILCQEINCAEAVDVS